MKPTGTFFNRSWLLVAGTAILLSVAACDRAKNNEAAVAELDSKLVGKGSDAATDDRIIFDPALTGNVNAQVNTRKSDSDASIEALDSAKLMRAPEPNVIGKEDCKGCGAKRAQTLGALAAEQGVTSGKGTCDAKMQYGAGWAKRMPPEFPVYPSSRVNEAGGVDGGICDIRVATFTTSATMQNVVDYYYTRARKSGFSAEYQIRDGEHVLGGTRDNDGGAYFVTFNPHSGTGTSVEVVANNGR